MGPFITAYLKVNGRAERARARAEQLLSEFRERMCIAGLGQVSEVADGDAPHRPAPPTSRMPLRRRLRAVVRRN
jgi:hypothetical protein